MSQKVWKIGVAGLGTVGGGLLQFLSERSPQIERAHV